MLKRYLYALLAGLLTAVSCVKVNTDLGQNLSPREHRYDVFYENIPLKDIRVRRVDSTYAYSTYRMVVGAVKDERFGLTVKSAAFTLVPVDSILNFGRETVFEELFLTLRCDSLSVPADGDARAVQTMRMYALDENCDINRAKDFLYTGDVGKIDRALAGAQPVTDYTLVYGGEDTLNVHFSQTFYTALGNKWLSKATENERQEKVYRIDHADTLSNSSYQKDFPGLYLTCDPPSSGKGRFNLFQVKLDINTSSYLISGNYAELRFKAKYGGSTDFKDTSFIFMVGALSVPKDAANLPLQEAFNGITHTPLTELPPLDGMTLKTATDAKGDTWHYYQAGTKIYLEGGAGLRPVVSAEEIRNSLLRSFAANKVTDISKVIIDKASLVFTYKALDDYDKMSDYPRMLAPMHVSRYNIRGRVYGQTETIAYTDFPPVTDAGVSAENQGGLNRSRREYAPDISFHTQHLLKLDAPSPQDLEKQDIWMFIKAPETIVTQNVSSADSDYYNRMLYYSYLNSMYGGYGSYGYNNYNSYYSMMYYYSMMNTSSGTTSSVQNMADAARWYNAVLCGPDDPEGPVLRVVYSVPKDCIGE